MPSDFAEMGKHLEATIQVPEVSIAAIHNRAREDDARHRRGVLTALALGAVAVLGSSTVLAAILFGGVRVWLSGDKAAVAIRSFTLVLNPGVDDARRVTSEATFPVVLPVGIPKGMHMNVLLFSPDGHPSFIEVMYRNAKTDARRAFILVDSSTVNHGEVPTLPYGESLLSSQATHWNVGRETVIATGVAEQADVKAAMSEITPAESLTQTLPMLYGITVLADIDRLADAAELIAPSEGRSVLVDRDSLRGIASLAQSHKPLVFIRATTFDTFPMLAGKPDFGRATRHHSRAVAVSAGGVRAIEAVLETKACGNGRTSGGFTCEVLINERAGRNYRIWMLPVNGSAATKYVVDSRTFRVRQAG